ncbi:MAG: aminotransferase [Bacteroidia bacterium]|nr:MAG: aminotransferase [Bacteroidia bacterium]
MILRDKLESFGTTIFTVMSALAQKHNAINLSQGFPDFDPDPLLLEIARKYFSSSFQQYAPMPGCIELRETVSDIIYNCYKRKVNPETEITITAGATQAIYTAIASFVDRGDEVIIFEPAYDCYAPAVIVNGGVPVYSELKYPDFKIDWNEVKDKITSKTKMIIINSPHNPTGTTLSREDLLQLQEITRKTNIIVLSDEVYEHIIFDNQEHQSVLRFDELFQRSIMVSSFGKTIHTTGWKIGYLVAPEPLMKIIRKVHQYLVFAVNHPLQKTIAEYLNNPQNYLSLKKFYQDKRDYFLSLLNTSYFKPLSTQGTYFILLDYSKLSFNQDTKFVIELVEKYKIAAVPMSVFYHTKKDYHLLRFCFAKKNETLEKAAQIIKTLKN